jgi:Asp-tRNA(Asn)/Glu-tRNA(Gln) amidotransferase A subunit family amidase
MTKASSGARRVESAAVPSGHDIARAVQAGSMTAHQAVADALERVSVAEPDVQAFEYLDAKAAIAEADRGDAMSRKGTLAGVPIGVKDIIDTGDMPTRNGCVHEFERRPLVDAVVVQRLRAAGAVPLGKTTTTECAFYHPTKTRNPHDLARTPGGSSSGSAAAIAAGMVPIALGSQTAGSIVRPAAFCGVWGMKPSFGLVPRTGVLMLGHSLDHVGALAGSAKDLARTIDVMSGDDGIDLATWGKQPIRLEHALTYPLERPRLGFAPSFAWLEMGPDAAARFEALANRLGAETIDMGPDFEAAAAIHRCVMSHEMSHHLWQKYLDGGERLSAHLRAFLIEGRGVEASRYFDALQRIEHMKRKAEKLFRPFDAIITPAAPGEAPEGLAFTGSRAFCLLWTVLGLPAINVPGLKGEWGLPLGVQVVGAFGTDVQTLRAAAWLAEELSTASA